MKLKTATTACISSIVLSISMLISNAAFSEIIIVNLQNGVLTIMPAEGYLKTRTSRVFSSSNNDQQVVELVSDKIPRAIIQSIFGEGSTAWCLGDHPLAIATHFEREKNSVTHARYNYILFYVPENDWPLRLLNLSKKERRVTGFMCPKEYNQIVTFSFSFNDNVMEAMQQGDIPRNGSIDIKKVEQNASLNRIMRKIEKFLNR